jgi:hypothetical protein
MKHGYLFKKENMVIFQKNVMSLLSTRNWFLIMKYHVSSLTCFTNFVYLVSDIFRRKKFHNNYLLCNGVFVNVISKVFPVEGTMACRAWK